MSSETADARALQAEDVVAFVERYGHLAAVGLLMVFMLWTRLLNFGAFRDQEGVAFSGVDSWYHWRTTEWTTENFPWTMPYEVYTGFPDGNYVGQFGTLFDQLVAAVAMIIGLGSPTQSDIYLAALIVVPVLAALVAIPVYVIATKVADGNRLAGLVAVTILALSPGSFTSRTTTGSFDHTVAEVLFMAVAVLALIVALRTAERDKPIWELVKAKEYDPLKPSATYAALAGVAISLYLWTWPPGVVFLGILGVFFAVQLALDFVRGVSPDHVAFVGAISMAVPAVFGVVMADVYSFSSVTAFGLLQPSVAFLVAVGCVFMAWLAREWDARDIDRVFYPVAILGLLLAGLAVLSIVLPELYNSLVTNLTSRLMPLNTSDTGLTVQEVQPPGSFVDQAWSEFRMGLYLFILGLIMVAARSLTGKRYRAEHTLVIVWGLFLASMAATQVRFWYYFVLPVAILSGYTIGQLIDLIDLRPVDSIRELEGYQVLSILLVLMIVLVPFAPAISGATAVDVGKDAGQDYNSAIWEEPNAYMQENTPEPGNLYGAGHDDELEYFGSYDIPPNQDYDYPDGAYGVMSWWDYGHLITTQGERIPHANPFQQHARSASAYLQAPSEEKANEVLDAINAGMDPRLDANGNVTVDAPDDVDNDMPYVMIDYQMASTKFNAISQWTGPGLGEYVGQTELNLGQNQSQQVPVPGEAYENTQLAKLYLQDTNGLEHYRLIHESDRYAYVGGFVQGQQPNPFAGLDQGTNWNQSRSQAARIQQANMQNSLFGNAYEGQLESTVKSFERVEGATLSGTADQVDAANASAIVTLDLETNTGRTFTYSQTAEVADDGSFEVTVPYATEESLGPDDGYTDSAVEANGSYEVFVGSGQDFYQANATVDEPSIYEGETVSVSGFEEVDIGGGNETDGGNESDDGGSDGSDTDTAPANDGSDDDSTSTSDDTTTHVGDARVAGA
ncbi:putative membrane protein, required for N-linked glycosylation [Halovivax ruber XH-70]|uniref:dolichyl-phosphooligosaccharide-protein glycotransferase n=1 Tax=Halovivax ruber (strain DSM 18193 / JCM 13892 / XH-70) TaxID=797302 RepID=L0I9V3_HALRX|nr:oligosaccharyl transferase, archaeosortase A system-associated [Halovivax ruber]AGB15608.1 putative membrane protein, required for N-linked glycosylation [Halovivax ruber XH-70]